MQKPVVVRIHPKSKPLPQQAMWCFTQQCEGVPSPTDPEKTDNIQADFWRYILRLDNSVAAKGWEGPIGV